MSVTHVLLLNGWAQLQDKRAENGKHVGSSLICGGVSMCRFIDGRIFSQSLSEFCSLDLVFLSFYPKEPRAITRSIPHTC